MIDVLTLLAFFVAAVAEAWIAVDWQDAREERQLVRLGALDVAGNIVGMASAYLAATRQQPTWLAAAILGSAVGTVYARWRRE